MTQSKTNCFSGKTALLFLILSFSVSVTGFAGWPFDKNPKPVQPPQAPIGEKAGAVQKPAAATPLTHYQLANQLIREGKLDEAIHEYEEELKVNPKNATAHNNMANTLVGKGRVKDAIQHFQEAVKINPDFLEAHNNLGIALASMGNMNEAVGELTAAVNKHPESADLHNSLGTVLAQQGKMNEAADQFSQAIKIRPNFEKAKENFELAMRVQSANQENKK